MKRYEDREVISRRECVVLNCDLCGKKAEHPECEAWEWGSAGTGSGKLEWQYTIDGDYNSNELDLCYECAEAVAEAIRNGQLKSLAPAAKEK